MGQEIPFTIRKIYKIFKNYFNGNDFTYLEKSKLTLNLLERYDIKLGGKYNLNI